MAGRLEGRGVVVTGATKGLGRETALLMAAEGARVVAVGRDAADGRSLQDEAAALPGSVTFHAGDVRDEETHTGAIARCREGGRLDAYVNNAGILGPEGPLHETSLDDWEEVNAVNMRGVFLGCRAAIRAMREDGGGQHRQRRLASSPSRPTRSSPRTPPPSTACWGSRAALAVDYAAGRHPGQLRAAGGHGDADDPGVLRRAATTPRPRAGRWRTPTPSSASPGRARWPRRCCSWRSDESSFVSGAELLVDGALTVKAY